MQWLFRSGLPALLIGLVVAAGGCRRTVRPAPPLSDEFESKRLSKLSDEYWEFLVSEQPIWATFLGDRRRDTELPDLSEEALAYAGEQLQRLHEEVESLDPDRLAEPDRITRESLLSLLSSHLETRVCRQELWDLNPLDGVQASLAELPHLHGITEPDHARSLEVRYLRSPVLMDQHIDNLRRGLKRGFVAPKVSVERVISQLDRLMLPKPEASEFLAAVRIPAAWRDSDRLQARRSLAEAVRSAVYPSLRKYRDFLAMEYLPHARDAIGLAANKSGNACYQARIRATTGLELSPKEVHELGWKELQRNQLEMRRIAVKLTGTEDLEKVERMLAENPRQRVRTPEELVAYNRSIVERAQRAAKKMFGKLPTLPVEVQPIDRQREKDSPPGYYYQGSTTTKRPGLYFLNTYDAPNRLLFQMEPLAFHETVPGHHLQIALAQELRGLPKFRRELGEPIFKEGWAHYAEVLADEMKLYSSEEARFGMLSDQALRAARLVVDTGIHAMGWTREQAITFLVQNTAESYESAAREVDRYIVWPAQALTYKLGQLEILRLREEAMERLGPRFDLKSFHDRVLANGAVPMPVLRRVMEQWVDAVARAGEASPQPRAAAHR